MDIVERLRSPEVFLSHGQMISPVAYEAADEIKRLREQIRYQEHRDGRVGTHDPICYEYGPSHYECALREIERLQEAKCDQ